MFNKIWKNNSTCFKALFKTYRYIIYIESDGYYILGEFTFWRDKIKTKSINNIVNAVAECNEHIYPRIYRLFNILASLLVTTTTSETLKHLKTYLRNILHKVYTRLFV